MNKIEYVLGNVAAIRELYPPVDIITPNPLRGSSKKISTLADVIEHYTRSSLDTDGIAIQPDSLKVSHEPGADQYTVEFEPLDQAAGEQFATMHQRFMSEDCAGQAYNGCKQMEEIPGAWNPMAGCKVNKQDISKWKFFLPLGMPLARQKSVTLLHYPPYGAMETADYLNNTTLHRWTRLLEHVGIKDKAEQKRYWSILDVNPVAAPGSGESEYPNDYFPVMMASVFFDNETWHCDYIRSALEIMLNPPHNNGNPYTLPLLVGGSPLYDPQAPGWFRVRYKDQKLTDGSYALEREHDEPMANVTQAGFVRIRPESKKLTPYMIANHMIAAGVTGKCCTSNKDKAPDIRVYEAQDLVAASFLQQYDQRPDIDPKTARKNACMDWFGNEEGAGPPQQSSTNPGNLKIIGALAQMDLFIDYRPNKVPQVVPKYSYQEAVDRVVKYGGETFDPCADGCGAKWSSCGNADHEPPAG
jgi:hypothetical protein